MLYRTPPKRVVRALLAELDELRRRLGASISTPRPWTGTLRRQARASTARSSTAIEGYHVSQDVALAIVDGASAGEDPDRSAVAGYALAMEHVGVLSDDPTFRWLDRVVLDLHFELCSWQRTARPGRWRTGPVHVTSPGGGVAYRAPDAEDVPALMGEAVRWLAEGDLDAHVVVRAAMAHLHLVSIHPFHDGNGRISRVVQSLVLAREGLLAPELGSIEEYLARNTSAYYAVLQEVQGGAYQPERDATPWIRFCLEAHRVQALERLALAREAARRWDALEALVGERGWPERLVIALERALTGGVDRAGYADEAAVSLPTASNDLRRLLDAGWIDRIGLARSTRYVASDDLRRRVG